MNISQPPSTSQALYAPSSEPKPPAKDRSGQIQTACANAASRRLTSGMPVDEVKQLLSDNLEELSIFLQDAAENATTAETLSEALHLFLTEATECQKNQLACILCNPASAPEGILNTKPLKAHHIELLARKIIVDPLNIKMSQLQYIARPLREKILDHIYFKLKPEKETHYTITAQLKGLFGKYPFAPELCLQWEEDYLHKYPEMHFPQNQNCEGFSPTLQDCIKKVLFSPVSQLSSSDLELLSEYSDRDCSRAQKESLHLWLCTLIEHKTSELAERPDLLEILENFISPVTPDSYKCNIPYVDQLGHALLTAEKKAVESLRHKLEGATDQRENLQLFTQWKRQVLHKVQFVPEIFSSQGLPAYSSLQHWKLWAIEQQKLLDELIAMAQNSEGLGKPGFWRTIDSDTLRKFKLAGLSFDVKEVYDNDAVITVLKMVRHSDQKRYLEQHHHRMTEEELVIIATRAVDEVAGHIINNTRHLSPVALAEIGRCHPRWVLPLVEKGDFKAPEAIPALARLASAFEPLAEAALQGRYNQHLTPSWCARIAANFPRLSAQIWDDFCQHLDNSQPATCLSDEWREAIAHLCRHESIARQVLKYPPTSVCPKLLMTVACYHKSLIHQELINTLKDELYYMDKIIKTHGFAVIDPLLTPEESTDLKRELIEGGGLNPEDYPELVPEDDVQLSFKLAQSWRDRADAMPVGAVWQSQSDFNKQSFLKRWPYLQERFSVEKSLSLKEATELLSKPESWHEVTETTVINICRFPPLAQEVCFDSEYETLISKLTPEQQFAIWYQYNDTANSALLCKRLSTAQIHTLLGRHFKLVYHHLGKLSKCTNEQIADIFSNQVQHANAMMLLTNKSEPIIAIRNRLEGEHWFTIALQHKYVASSLFGVDYKDIRNKLSEKHIYQLALMNRPVLNFILTHAEMAEITNSWGAEQWCILCEEHPESFAVIYQKMKQSSPECQEVFSARNLLKFRGHSKLWSQIVDSMDESDRQWLLDQPIHVPVARHEVIIPHKNNADFYPFHHPLWGGMNRSGCCNGYAQDFIRYARTHKYPANYIRKQHLSFLKVRSFMPYRVHALQERQAYNCRNKVTLLSGNCLVRDSTFDITPALKISKAEGGTVLNSESHSVAMATHDKDLYYFDSNNGLWRWRNFEPIHHLGQLTRTVEETLFKTDTRDLNITATQNLLGVHFPKKKKAQFQPEWISKSKWERTSTN